MQYGFSYRPAAGVSSDFERLLKRFISAGTVRYEDFAKVWREMKMSYIYAGRDLERELKEFIEECMAIAVKLFLPPYQFETRVGGLYILYALYNTQPFNPKVKIRVTLEQWTEMIDFHNLVKSESHYDISFIFVRLRLDGAFNFVAMPVELYPEVVGHSAGEMPAVEVGKPLDVLPAEATVQLQAVHDQYWKVKCALAGPYSHAPDPSLDVVESNFVEEVAKTIKEYEEQAKHRLNDETSGKAKRAGAAGARNGGDSGSDSDKQKKAVAGKARAKGKGASAPVDDPGTNAGGRGSRSVNASATLPAAADSRDKGGRGSGRPAAKTSSAAAEDGAGPLLADGSRRADDGGGDDDSAAKRLRGEAQRSRLRRATGDGKELTPASKRASAEKPSSTRKPQRGRRKKSTSSSSTSTSTSMWTLSSGSDAESDSVHSVHDSAVSDSEVDGKRKTKRMAAGHMAVSRGGKPAARGSRSSSSMAAAAAACAATSDSVGESVGTDDYPVYLDMPQL